MYVKPLDIMCDSFIFYGGIWYLIPNMYKLPAFLRQETLTIVMIIMGASVNQNI